MLANAYVSICIECQHTKLIKTYTYIFPEASLFLPTDFPLKNQFATLDQKSPHCHGEMVRKSNLTNTDKSLLSSFVYLHLSHDYNDQDKLFFCNQDQDFLEKIPRLIVRTDYYFVPSLFLIPSFEQELSNLFPRKETVFHFLGRYLFGCFIPQMWSGDLLLDTIRHI
ncbi:putative Type 1 galactoside alpha-(1,2)-fucosyltransferase [Rosa chinensis]|uniref:Fucosyltransferase n=1 Tax=Rosa chinensis TaxID=74649 RepID=A0A2P6RF05_ROSCH|nr:putative Type 1 galactoside alpha-(1,2)-fucosyltransferase [Rosa chinensis]